MRNVDWFEVKKLLKEEIKFYSEKCCTVEIDDRDRLISAAKIEAFVTILNLQGEEPEQNE